MIYFTVFILSAIPVIRFDLLAKKGKENVWYWILLAVFVLLAGMRFRVGGDTLIYMSEFESYPKLDELKYFDFETARFNPLWYVFNALCKSVSDNFTFFQFAHAFVVNISFFHFFRKFCPRYFFSAILVWFVGYWCYFNMEILREVLCVSLLLWATGWLMEKRYIPYYLVCVVALFFHYSSIIMAFIPLLLVFFKKPNAMLQIVMLILTVVLVHIVNIPHMVVSLLFDNEQLVQTIENYLEVDSRNLTGMLIEIVEYLPVLGIIWLREHNCFKDEYDFVPLISCVVIFYGMATFVGAASRFVNYFVPFIIIVLVNTIYHILERNDFRLYQVSTCISVITLFLVAFNYTHYYIKDESENCPGTRGYSLFVPYRSVLNPQIDDSRETMVENLRNVAIMF